MTFQCSTTRAGDMLPVVLPMCLKGATTATSSPDQSPRDTLESELCSTASGSHCGTSDTQSVGVAAWMFAEIPPLPSAWLVDVKRTFIEVKPTPQGTRNRARSLPARCQGEDVASLPSTCYNTSSQTATLTAHDSAAGSFPLGAVVVVDGLIQAPAFNGRIGFVLAFEEESDRYVVVLDPTAGGSRSERRQVKVRGGHLHLHAASAEPPPPSFEPHVDSPVRRIPMPPFAEPNFAAPPQQLVFEPICLSSQTASDDSMPSTPRWEDMEPVSEPATFSLVAGLGFVDSCVHSFDVACNVTAPLCESSFLGSPFESFFVPATASVCEEYFVPASACTTQAIYAVNDFDDFSYANWAARCGA